MPEERKPVIKKLSQGTLDLKFMKRSKERARIEEDNEERQVLYRDQLATLHNSADKVVLIGSHFDVMTYLPCRLSFGGMEPKIEKLNQPKLTGLYETTAKEEPAAPMEETDVTNEEMASHYTAVQETIAKKFKKRMCHREFVAPNKRTKSTNFLMPSEDKKFNIIGEN